MDTLVAVDENLFGTIRYLEYSGHPVLRIKRGTGDNAIHNQLENYASTYDMKVAFFTRDKGFLKYLDRTYFLYLITLPTMVTQMEQARLIELIVEMDFPNRYDPQFEVNIRHVFRQMDGNNVVEIESAITVHPKKDNDT